MVKRWIGLGAWLADGTPIDCVDVVLFEYDFGEQGFEYEVDVQGIFNPRYAVLFPQHIMAYEESLRALGT